MMNARQQNVSKQSKLTDMQQAVLDFIGNYKDEFERPPTFREIGNHFKVNVKAAYDHASRLRKKGYIDWGRQSRTIRILKKEA